VYQVIAGRLCDGEVQHRPVSVIAAWRSRGRADAEAVILHGWSVSDE
jgi:hypothetical protein